MRTAWIILAVIAGCGSPQAKPAGQRPAVPVVTATALRADVPLVLRTVGSAAASELVEVKPRVGGAIAAMHFREGAEVAAGDRLVSLDDRSYVAAVARADAEHTRTRAAIAQAEAVLARDRLQRDLADSEAKRIADLDAKGLATAQQAEQSRNARAESLATCAASEAALATARAAADSAAASLVQARLDLSWCTVTAPIAGRTGMLGLDAGNLVVAGQTTLLTIARMQPMHVLFSLPAGELARVRAAAAAGSVAVAATPEGGAASTGTLEVIANQVDAATGTVALRAAFPNQDGRLWPGQHCRVEITVGVDRGALTVPAAAVQTGQRGAFVWAIASDGTATAKPVTVTRIADRVAVLADGLADGEQVVVDGQVRLAPGVATMTAEPAGAAAGGHGKGGGKSGKPAGSGGTATAAGTPRP